MDKVKKLTTQKGITLVALIITIIVLLILAVVAIRAVQGDGIISKAKEAQTKYEDAQNEEEIKLALNEWKIVGATTNKTFAEFMAEKFGENKVQAGSSESEVIVTLANGSQYKVTEDGTITSIIREPVNISKGSFVKYNVGYTDMYLTGKNYNATNGWRLLGYTDNGDGTLSNVKLISTGIPAKLYYHYSTNATTNGWWVPAGSTAEFRAELTRLGDKSYTTYSSADETDSNYPAMRAAAGMYNNFEAISFRYGTSNDANKGFYTSITKYGATTQEDITYSENSNATATPTGGELFNLYGDNAKVRLLTLPELNMAVRPTGNTTNIDNATQISEAEDPTGLFRLNKLDSAYTNGTYWLASPYPNSGYDSNVCYVNFYGDVNYYDSYRSGVRPVVCLTSNIQLLDTNGDGVLEIQ